MLLSRPAVLNWGNYIPSGTFGDVWRHYLWSKPENLLDATGIYPVGRSQGCCSPFYNAQDHTHHQTHHYLVQYVNPAFDQLVQ